MFCLVALTIKYQRAFYNVINTANVSVLLVLTLYSDSQLLCVVKVIQPVYHQKTASWFGELIYFHLSSFTYN